MYKENKNINLFKFIFLLNIMITFILPLGTTNDIYIASSILFPSIKTFFKSNSIKNFIVILNKSNIDYFKNVCNEYLSILNIKIIDEIFIYNKTRNINTYYYQMLLKIYVSKYIETDKYITLDADCIFTKKCDETNFYDDFCFYNKVNKKDLWIKRTEKVLNIDINFSTNQTPFIFITKFVLDMINNINVPEFILKDHCSEYSLYLGFLIKNNLWDNHYYNFNFTSPIINYNMVNNKYIDIEVKLNEAFLVNDKQVITCIQSRVNILDNYIDTLKNYIPNITYKKLNIGLLTVISKGEYFERYKDALFIKKDYCKYHNYNFIIKILDECSGWDKILLLEKELKNYDYIFTSDADVIITNRDIRIEDIINKYYNDNAICYMTEDYNSLNSGNIIWKNNQDTINFLSKIIKNRNSELRYTLNKPYKSIGIYEQPSIIYTINKEYDYYKDKIIIIPQYEINSYLPFVVKNDDDINRSSFKSDDFLIHFAGFNYKKNNNLREKINLPLLIKKFCAFYKIQIIRKEGRDYGSIY
jgi:hypothetical protein